MRLIVDKAGHPLEGGALVPRPFDSAAWRAQLVGAASGRMAQSVDGWPVELVAVGSDLFALYAPLDLVGFLVARGLAPDELPAVEAQLLSARVDLSSDEITALVQLWE